MAKSSAGTRGAAVEVDRRVLGGADEYDVAVRIGGEVAGAEAVAAGVVAGGRLRGVQFRGGLIVGVAALTGGR
jgi:hypothetical protein